MFELRGGTCILRSFSLPEIEFEKYYNWLCDYEVIKTLNLPSYVLPVSRSTVEDYIKEVSRSDSDVFLAIYDKHTDNFIGTLKIGAISRLSGTADIGIMIGDRSFWGKGIGTSAISLSVEYCFNRLGLRKVTAGLMSINPGMKKCFEKIGFKQEACFRQQDFFEGGYVDHIYLGCFKEEYLKKH